MQTLKEIFFISNYPRLQGDEGWGKHLLRLLKTYGWLLLALIAVAPIIMLTDKFVTDVLHHKSLSAHNKELFREFHKKLGFVYSFFFICLMGPFFEELIFRLPLSFKIRYVVVGLLIGLLYLGSGVLTTRTAGLAGMVAMPFIIITGGLCWFFLPVTPLDIADSSKRYCTLISIALFGLMHVVNYTPLDTALIWLYPIYVIPQLLMGWAISYLRFKNGFFWGLMLHCLINTVATLLAFKYQ